MQQNPILSFPKLHYPQSETLCLTALIHCINAMSAEWKDQEKHPLFQVGNLQVLFQAPR